MNMSANRENYKKKRPPESSGGCTLCHYSDRSGEKPYCTFIICIRLQKVNVFFENVSCQFLKKDYT